MCMFDMTLELVNKQQRRDNLLNYHQFLSSVMQVMKPRKCFLMT